MEKWFKKCKLSWRTGAAVFVPPMDLSPPPKLYGFLCLFSETITTGSTKQKIPYQVIPLSLTKTETFTPSIEKSQQHPLNLCVCESTVPTPLPKRSTTLLMNVKKFQLKWTALSVTKPPIWTLLTPLLCLLCLAEWLLLNLQNSNGTKRFV